MKIGFEHTKMKLRTSGIKCSHQNRPNTKKNDPNIGKKHENAEQERHSAS